MVDVSVAHSSLAVLVLLSVCACTAGNVTPESRRDNTKTATTQALLEDRSWTVLLQLLVMVALSYVFRIYAKVTVAAAKRLMCFCFN